MVNIFLGCKRISSLVGAASILATFNNLLAYPFTVFIHLFSFQKCKPKFVQIVVPILLVYH